METIMIAGHFDSLADLCDYANGLVGDSLVDYETHTVKKVVHFHFVSSLPSGIDAALLVEVAGPEETSEKFVTQELSDITIRKKR